MTEARKLPPPLPPRLDWFVHTQMDQLTQDGIPAWFHGTISRETAENLLESQPLGSFLIRVSHSHVGYTLSYKAPGCCRHFMVKLLDDGSFVIPGEQVAHASLGALVTFHQQHPVQSRAEELLTQPCGQEDPENVDYQDLFIYSTALAEDACRSAHGPGDRRPTDSKPSTETDRGPSPEAPLGEARQGVWRNLKALPQVGKRLQEQLRSRLSAVSFSSLRDPGRTAATQGSGASTGSQGHSGHPARAGSVSSAESSVATSLKSLSQPSRDRDAPSRKATRSTSWSEPTPRHRSWHHAAVRALSSHGSEPRPGDLEQPEDWLPEEYRPPPPFAPGYC